MGRIAPLTTWRTSISNSSLPPTEKLVCMMLSTYMNEQGDSAFPSRDRLARNCSISPRTVTRVLASLREKGWLVGQAVRGRPTRYTATVPEVTGVLYPPSGGETPVTRGVDTGDTRTIQELPKKEEVLRTSHDGSSDHRALFGALMEVMGRSPEGGESARWGRVAKLMAAEHVQPKDVTTRAGRYRARWPSLPLSPQALWNNWGRFASDNTDGIDWSRYDAG